MGFFCDESMNHLLSSPFPLRGLRIREGTHSHSHCHSSLGVSCGEMVIFGDREAPTRPTCVVLGSKIFTTRSPFSSNVCLGVSKKTTWPNLSTSGVSWISSLQKVSWQVLWGSHTLGSRIFFPECSQKWLVGTNITFGFLQQQFWYLTVWQSLQKNSLTQHWTARHTEKNNESPHQTSWICLFSLTFELQSSAPPDLYLCSRSSMHWKGNRKCRKLQKFSLGILSKQELDI